MHSNQKERGNVLFVILLAIILLGALTFSVTRSSRTNTNLDERQAGLFAAEIVNFASAVGSAVNRIRNSGDCTLKELSFYNDIDGNGILDASLPDSQYLNPNTSDDRCMVFNKEGGGIEYQAPPSRALILDAAYPGHGYGEYIFTAGLSFYRIGEMCQNTTCTDLAIVLQGLNKETCEAINKQIYNRPDIPKHETWSWSPNTSSASDFYRGEFKNWSANYTLQHPSTSFLSGNPMGCYDRRWISGDPLYLFYYILWAR